MGAVTPVMTLVEVNLVPRDSDGRVIHDAASVEVSKTQHIVITIIIVIITITQKILSSRQLRKDD